MEAEVDAEMDTDSDYLENKGWTRMPVRSVWCWQQPRFHALFRKEDALETQRALDRERTVKKQK